MNKDKVIDVLGNIDDDMTEQVQMLRNRHIRPVWIKWVAAAACFVAVMIVSLFFVRYFNMIEPGPTEGPHEQMNSQPIEEVQLNVLVGIYVDGKLYIPEPALSTEATEENIGSHVGHVSPDNITVTNLCVFSYLPDDGMTSRIIVPFDGRYYVYYFVAYEPDGTDTWPADLLKNTAYIKIWGSYEGMVSNTVPALLTISDAEGIADMQAFLAGLCPKYTISELNRYYLDLFKNYFQEGELQLTEEGRIVFGGNVAASIKLSELVNGEGCWIEVVMRDNTRLLYQYKEGAGVIWCCDFGYILTEDQVEEINQLIGLK